MIVHMYVFVQVGKSATSYEPLTEADLDSIDHEVKLYVSGVIPELEVQCNTTGVCTYVLL